MLSELESKGVDIVNIAAKALDDATLLSELLKGLQSKNDTLRSNCFQVLHYISEKNPPAIILVLGFFCPPAWKQEYVSPVDFGENPS